MMTDTNTPASVVEAAFRQGFLSGNFAGGGKASPIAEEKAWLNYAALSKQPDAADSEPSGLAKRARQEAAMLREIAVSEARGVDWQVNLNATADFLTALRTDRKAVLEEAAKVARDVAERRFTKDMRHLALLIEKQILALAEGAGK